MSRVIITCAVVLLVAGVALVTYDALALRSGYTTVLPILHTYWQDLVSSLGTMGWMLIVIGLIAIVLFIGRMPKFGKY